MTFHQTPGFLIIKSRLLECQRCQLCIIQTEFSKKESKDKEQILVARLGSFFKQCSRQYWVKHISLSARTLGHPFYFIQNQIIEFKKIRDQRWIAKQTWNKKKSPPPTPPTSPKKKKNPLDCKRCVKKSKQAVVEVVPSSG